MPMQIIAGGGPSREAPGEDSGADEDELACEDSPMGAELDIIIDHQGLQKNSNARDMRTAVMCILGSIDGFGEIGEWCVFLVEKKDKPNQG